MSGYYGGGGGSGSGYGGGGGGGSHNYNSHHQSSQSSYSNYPPPHHNQHSNYGPPPPQSYNRGGGGYDDPYGPPQPHYSDHHHQQQPFPPDEFRAPPEVAVDPNAFRRFFAYHLTTLTYNSKPAITNLTLFAHQHLLRMSTVVASCLEDHLRTCPPANRLPALYLLDSISKNIGPPYVSLFCRFIERSFLSAYQIVDPQTKVKMEELLGTWRTGGSDGGELFKTADERGPTGRVQRGIEMTLFGPGGRGGGIGGGGRALRDNENYMTGMQQLPAAANREERSGVLLDVRKLLQIRQDQSLLNPEDTVNTSQIMALQKLETLVTDTQLTSDQVSQIRVQLAALAPRDPPPPPRVPTPEPVVPATNLNGGIDFSLLAQLKDLAGPNGDLASLLSGGTSTPVGAGGPADQAKNGAGKEDDGKDDRAAKEYDEALLALDLELSTTDILKPRPLGPSFLYNRFQKQCQQCGLRFLDSGTAQKAMEKHMDWHFTHKRRIREGAGRAQGRSWLALEEDWFKSDEVDLTYDNLEASSSAARAAPAAGTVDRAQLLLRKVLAPTDPSQVGKTCPICQDHLKSEFSEEEEDWVYYNAEEVDGVIYHATCYAEAASTRANRIKLEDSNRPSREGTPVDGRASGSLSNSAKKRKLQWDEFGSDDDTVLKKPKSEED